MKFTKTIINYNLPIHSTLSLYLTLLLGFAVCIQLHLSLSLSTSISLSLSFCLHPAPNLFLSRSPFLVSSLLRTISCLSLHRVPSLILDVYIFLTHCPFPLRSGSTYFSSFPFLLLPPFVYSCLFSLSDSVLLHLFLLLSVSICLGGQVGFSEGCTLTWWNGVSLFLQWRRHFAVRITAPDIDSEEEEDFRGHRELAGRSGKASNHCRH